MGYLWNIGKYKNPIRGRRIINNAMNIPTSTQYCNEIHNAGKAKRIRKIKTTLFFSLFFILSILLKNNFQLV